MTEVLVDLRWITEDRKVSPKMIVGRLQIAGIRGIGTEDRLVVGLRKELASPGATREVPMDGVLHRTAEALLWGERHRDRPWGEREDLLQAECREEDSLRGCQSTWPGLIQRKLSSLCRCCN